MEETQKRHLKKKGKKRTKISTKWTFLGFKIFEEHTQSKKYHVITELYNKLEYYIWYIGIFDKIFKSIRQRN